MLKIDFKRLYWNVMLGRRFRGKTFMIRPQGFSLRRQFVKARIPPGKEDFLEGFKGKWEASDSGSVKAFRAQRVIK